MPEIDDDANTTLEVTINPSISVYWSQERCWHGDKVKIVLRTAFLADGTAVDLTVSAKDGDDVIEIVKGQKITSSKLDYEYTINWKDKPPPAGKVQFLVTAATTKEPLVTGKTQAPLFVDLTPALFSY